MTADGNTPQLAPGATFNVFNLLSGGTAYDDLALDAEGLEPVPFVTASDGSDGYLAGQVEFVYGPDGVREMYIDGGTGARLLWTANDYGPEIDGLSSAVDDVTSLADNLQTASNSSIVVWLANPDGSWNPRPDWANDRIVDWQGPSAPPIGGMPEYARNNDRWSRSPVA